MIRVLFADDHELVRDSLSRLLSTYPDIEVTAQVANGYDTIRRAARGDVDVVLLDVFMPGPGFVPVLERINQMAEAPRVLMLSGYPEDRFAIRALRAGASGCFTKNQTAGQLAEAIREIYSGRRYVSDFLAQYLAVQVTLPGNDRPGHEQLSNREFEVLALFGEGHGATEIGAMLGISVKTVSTYRSRIIDKLGLHSTADIIRYAIESGIVR